MSRWWVHGAMCGMPCLGLTQLLLISPVSLPQNKRTLAFSLLLHHLFWFTGADSPELWASMSH